MIVCETERLRLREFSNDDVDFIIRLLNEQSFIRNIGDKKVRSAEQALTYLLEGPIASYQKFGFGLNLVELKESMIPIGMCGLINRDSLEDVDLGYAFLPEHWSQGYALEAATATMTIANQRHHLQRVVAITSPDNKSSTRLLEKIGFGYEGLKKIDDDGDECSFFAYEFSQPNEHME